MKAPAPDEGFSVALGPQKVTGSDRLITVPDFGAASPLRYTVAFITRRGVRALAVCGRTLTR